MRVVFRTDASVDIGTGHVMRCLTLADNIAARGGVCLFICREHLGNLIGLIMSKGYLVHVLPVNKLSITNNTYHNTENTHSHWLGATQLHDFQDCTPVMSGFKPDWLIVDHYGIDAIWERALKPYYSKLMVIDDLADRPHSCDFLLDQTFTRNIKDYKLRVPEECILLCGSQYALLRPEFAALRPYSLQRRERPVLRELLITMGGIDKDNATGQVLQALRSCQLTMECRITVVMGMKALWVDEVIQMSKVMPWKTRVLVGVHDMAELMSGSDLAIGAAGSTSWERCCMGLPTITFVLAENQIKVAEGLEKVGAAAIVTSLINMECQLAKLLSVFFSNPEKLNAMSKSSAAIVDGNGTSLVTALLEA